MSEEMVISGQIMEQARSWYVRLGSEQASADDWALFTNWLEESPVHVDAYDQIELMLSDLSTSQDNNDAAHADNVVQLIPKTKKIPKPSPKPVWGRYAGIAALLIAALTVFYTNNPFQPMSEQIYATNIGGHEEVVLKDGTRINLNTNTRIRVAMNKKTRTVTLENGEVFFDIAKDKKRPFIVNAMDTRITDVGTSFSVYVSEAALTISVADGIVDMQNNSQTARLIKGQQAVQKRGDANIAVRAIDVENISTWRDGVLVFEDTELSAIIPELNRYFQIPISYTDEKVANLTFSGVLNISDQTTMLGSMEALMPINSDIENGQILLSHKN